MQMNSAVKWSILLSGLLLLNASHGLADKFEMRNGKVYEGAILYEDSANIFIDTPSGAMVNVNKKNLLSVNGEPYNYAGAGTASRTLQTEDSKPSYMGKSSGDEGSVEQGKNIGVQFTTLEELSKGAAAPAAQHPLDESANDASTAVHPSGVTEQELRNYYEAHQEEFRMPVQLRLKFLNPPDFEDQSADAILKNPAANSAWRDAKWVKKEDQFNTYFSDAEYDKIFNLRENETLAATDREGVQYLFWAQSRKETYVMPYEEARPKVLTKVLQAKK